MVTIKKSVGRGGENLASDVQKVQRLLHAVFPATQLDLDGICRPKTIRRIVRFQSRFMKEPDGRIEAGGRTLERLNAAAPGMQEEWRGDSSLWSQEKKLASLNDRFRRKVELTIERLRLAGFKPKMVFGWRSVAVQLELVEKGVSRVRFSFHNAQKKDGTPNAYAADIIDRRWAWTKKAEDNGFWQTLGRAAKEEGLYWGGDWRSFKDWAHVQYFPNNKLQEIKRQSGLA